MALIQSLPVPAPDKFRRIQNDLENARYLPGKIYTSKKIAAIEKSRIFMTNWLCVARAEEVPNVGDYMTMRIMNEPIVIARTSPESVSAFMNMCLHRGVEIAYGTGNTKFFRCPYHAWTYDIAGNLKAAPLVDESRRDRSALPQLKTAIWRGWIFVNFDLDAIAFEDYIAPFERDLWYYRTGECRVAAKIEFDLACNWKCVAENILDLYHARIIHASTFGKFYKLGSEPLPATFYPNGGGHCEFDSSMRTADPNLPFPRLPWLPESLPVFSAKGMMFPNINFWSGTDSLRMWHLWPTATNKTHAVCYILMPEASLAIPDFEPKMEQVRRYVHAFIEEDRVALESLQQAVSSDRYEPGPLSNQENMIQHLLKRYVEVMGSELLSQTV